MSVDDAVRDEEVTDHALCEAAVDYVLQHVNTVQYLLQTIEQLTQQPFTRQRIKCVPAVPSSPAGMTRIQGGGQRMDASQVSAGYMWRNVRPDCDKGDVVLLEDHVAAVRRRHQQRQGKSDTDTNKTRQKATQDDKRRITTQQQLSSSRYLENYHRNVLSLVERNLRHELIHAFDDARGVIDPIDCLHQACSEIRAARLSGDCLVEQEFKRGRWSFMQGGLKCVQRRATAAVEMNPVCRGFAARAVTKTMPRCYTDYEPFAAALYSMGSYGEEHFDNATLHEEGNVT